jgi:two-component system, chemotaxis family, protein-glutamate methylesterase/glutaminase
VITLIHQQPDREGALAQILGRHSSLPVTVAEDGARLHPGVVNVAPPGVHTLVAAGPTIALIPSAAFPPSRPSADLLLTTLAITCGPRATVAVLSGRGHDGATGAAAIHRFGGIVVASNEASSTYFSMPHATIERDSTTDHVVALDDIADRLASIIARHTRPA